MTNDTITIPMTIDEVRFVLELLNNERWREHTSNTNRAIAESLVTRIVGRTVVTQSAARNEDDEYWSSREVELNDEHIDAECAARTRGW